jgi:hypothetical protein
MKSHDIRRLWLPLFLPNATIVLVQFWKPGRRLLIETLDIIKKEGLLSSGGQTTTSNWV